MQGNELSSAAEFRNVDVIRSLLELGATTEDHALSLEIALLTRNFKEVSTALQYATYNSRRLFEATSLALKTEKYVVVVERLVSERTTTKRDSFELAALAVAVFNRNSRLCCILCDSKFLPGPWTVHLCLYISGRDGKPDVIRQDARGIFEINPG